MLAADWSLYDLLALGLGYLLGSIPFGLILTRLAGHGDLRDIGSGNIGATNVLRTGNKKLAALTLLLDALKGTAAVLIGARFGPDAAILGGLGAFLGHLFPVWLGFRGGKGVATYIGVLLGLYWPGAIAFCAIWLVVAAVTRYSSLSALVASAAIPLILVLVGEDTIALSVPLFHRASLLAPRRQYRTPAARRGGAHWREKDLIRAADMLAARSGVQLSDRQRLSWLRLIRSENVGPATFRALVNQFGGAEAALDALPALSRRGGRASIRIFTEAEAEAELEAADRAGAQSRGHGREGLSAPRSPMSMRRRRSSTPKAGSSLPTLPSSPWSAPATGRPSDRSSRASLPPSSGLKASSLPQGLARGIDTAAHLAALERGTIAVLAGGIDIVYPPENADLQRAIGEQGLLLSERSPGFAPRGKDFPRRNRLISGISLGVVVVEAAERSGSLITARFAGEQGREVFAVPGSPLDPRSAGTNNLLKQGACLVTSAARHRRSSGADARAPGRAVWP